jgi:hypothetical protein
VRTPRQAGRARDQQHGEQLTLAIGEDEPAAAAPVGGQTVPVDQVEDRPVPPDPDEDEGQDEGVLADEREQGQLLLLGEVPARARGRAGMLPSQVMQQLLDHAGSRARYAAKVHRRGDDQCWYWIGAISDTGHGKFKASRARGPSVVVTAHVYGYQLRHGPISPRPGEDPVIGHRCDETSCQNPAHWELIERRVNDADYRQRRYRAGGPLADVRGARGRAVAIRTAIVEALAAGADVEAAVEAAAAAGLAEAPGLF